MSLIFFLIYIICPYFDIEWNAQVTMYYTYARTSIKTFSRINIHKKIFWWWNLTNYVEYLNYRKKTYLEYRCKLTTSTELYIKTVSFKKLSIPGLALLLASWIRFLVLDSELFEESLIVKQYSKEFWFNQNTKVVYFEITSEITESTYLF